MNWYKLGLKECLLTEMSQCINAQIWLETSRAAEEQQLSSWRAPAHGQCQTHVDMHREQRETRPTWRSYLSAWLEKVVLDASLGNKVNSHTVS